MKEDISVERNLFYSVIATYFEDHYLFDLAEFMLKYGSTYHDGIEDPKAIRAFAKFLRKREKIEMK